MRDEVKIPITNVPNLPSIIYTIDTSGVVEIPLLFIHRSSLVEVTSLQIPRHARQLDHHSIQLLGHLDLTPQSTRFC